MEPTPERAGRGARLANSLVGVGATSFIPVADLDPRLSREILQALEEAGVAAYVRPPDPAQGPYRDVVVPPRPQDRLHVDAELLGVARAVLAERGLSFGQPVEVDSDAAGEPGEGSTGLDERAAWEAIVAGWSTPADGPEIAPWPVNEDLDGPPRADAAPKRVFAREEPTETVDLPGYDEGHFEPPAPPPLPRLGRRTTACLLVLAAGVVLLLRPGLLGLPTSDGVAALGVGAVIGGIVALIVGMRDTLPIDDGPDDGAVV